MKFYLAEASFNKSHTFTVCVLGKPKAEERELNPGLYSHKHVSSQGQGLHSCYIEDLEVVVK